MGKVYRSKKLQAEMKAYIEYNLNSQNGWEGADPDIVDEIFEKAMLTADDEIALAAKRTLAESNPNKQSEPNDYYIYDSLDRPLGINPKYR